jgi:4-hydroxyphenylacetate 3-hydroxylase C terminal
MRSDEARRPSTSTACGPWRVSCEATRCYHAIPCTSTSATTISSRVLQMPADVSVLSEDATRRIFEQNWAAPTWAATDKMKLFKLAGDLLGTDFAGRHAQYERFCMGSAFVVREHVGRETPWPEILNYADGLLKSYGPATDEVLAKEVAPGDRGTGDAQGES